MKPTRHRMNWYDDHDWLNFISFYLDPRFTCTISFINTMDSSDNGDLDFNGFSAENVVLAHERLDELLKNASVIKYTDLDDDQYDSDYDIRHAT